MRRSIFAVFAVLTPLVAMPALAQEETGSDIQPYESRTNPDAENISGHSGLTLTGTVVEWNDEQLTLRTSTGIEHVQIVPDTQRPVELTAGEDFDTDADADLETTMDDQDTLPATGSELPLAATPAPSGRIFRCQGGAIG